MCFIFAASTSFANKRELHESLNLNVYLKTAYKVEHLNDNAKPTWQAYIQTQRIENCRKLKKLL